MSGAGVRGEILVRVCWALRQAINSNTFLLDPSTLSYCGVLLLPSELFSLVKTKNIKDCFVLLLCGWQKWLEILSLCQQLLTAVRTETFRCLTSWHSLHSVLQIQISINKNSLITSNGKKNWDYQPVVVFTCLQGVGHDHAAAKQTKIVFVLLLILAISEFSSKIRALK